MTDQQLLDLWRSDEVFKQTSMVASLRAIADAAAAEEREAGDKLTVETLKRLARQKPIRGPSEAALFEAADFFEKGLHRTPPPVKTPGQVLQDKLEPVCGGKLMIEFCDDLARAVLEAAKQRKDTP
jgi:hypothetical protein